LRIWLDGKPGLQQDAVVRRSLRGARGRSGMASLGEFDALIESLGQLTIEYLKSLNVGGRVRIFHDEHSGSAHLEICLDDQSWATQSAAIDKMIEIRSIFLDEIAIDYVFVDDDSCGTSAEPTETRSFVMA
jgi:hypothetical protein